MDAVFNRLTISEIRDPDFASDLSDALDATFALLEASRIPRQVDVDERAKPLEIQALRGRIRAQQQLEVALPDPALEDVSVTSLELSASPEAGAVAAAVESDVHVGEIRSLGQFIADPANGVVILREQDAASVEPAALHLWVCAQ